MAKSKVSQHLELTKLEIENLTLKLRVFLQKNLKQVADGLKNQNQSAIQSASVINSISTILDNAGLSEEIAKLGAPYLRQLDFIKTMYAENGDKDIFAAIDQGVVEQLIHFDLDRATTTLESRIGDLRSTLMTVALGGDMSTINEVIDAAPEKIQIDLETELNTMTSSFARSVTSAIADKLGYELFEYMGPDDPITREFCQHVLEDRDPPVYTSDEIASMDNGSDLDVMTYAGGYNCRHWWVPVSDEKAKELGYNSEEGD